VDEAAVEARSVVVLVVAGEAQLNVLRLDRMKARGKKLKRKRGAGVSFGELIRKLWQPKPEGLESKAAPEKKRKSAAKGRRVRRGSRTRPT
jgi:hypothetical protein